MPPAPKPAEAASQLAASRLADFTGLDTESARTQLLPFLESFQDRDALRSHLKDLLGPGATQANFISQYVDSRFPPLRSKPTAASSKPGSSTANSASSLVAALPHSQRSYAKSSRQPKPSRITPQGGIGSGADLDEEELEQVQAAFRAQEAQGTLYRKGAQDFFSGSGASSRTRGTKGSSTSASGANSSGRASPVGTSVTSTTQSVDHAAVAAAEQVAAAAQAAAVAAAADEALLAELPPTAEMVAIDESIKLLSTHDEGTGASSTTTDKRRCFCNGRMHPPHPHVPLCLSCGLVICTALLPSPLASTTSCPSCSASPLLDAANRFMLLSRLAEKREALRDTQRTRALLLREERRRAREERRETRERELFPELGVGAGGAAARTKKATTAAAQTKTARVFRIDKTGRGLTLGSGKREEGKKGKKSRAGRNERERKANKDAAEVGGEGSKVKEGGDKVGGKVSDAKSTSTTAKDALSALKGGRAAQEAEEVPEDERQWPDGVKVFIDEDDDVFTLGGERRR